MPPPHPPGVCGGSTQWGCCGVLYVCGFTSGLMDADGAPSFQKGLHVSAMKQHGRRARDTATARHRSTPPHTPRHPTPTPPETARHRPKPPDTRRRRRPTPPDTARHTHTHNPLGSVGYGLATVPAFHLLVGLCRTLLFPFRGAGGRAYVSGRTPGPPPPAPPIGPPNAHQFVAMASGCQVDGLWR